MSQSSRNGTTGTRPLTRGARRELEDRTRRSLADELAAATGEPHSPTITGHGATAGDHGLRTDTMPTRRRSHSVTGAGSRPLSPTAHDEQEESDIPVHKSTRSPRRASFSQAEDRRELPADSYEEEALDDEYYDEGDTARIEPHQGEEDDEESTPRDIFEGRDLPPHLNARRDPVLNEATEGMSHSQREAFERRHQQQWAKPHLNPENQMAGPSHDKGKGFDPENFGGVHMEPEEHDVELQRDLLYQANMMRDHRAYGYRGQQAPRNSHDPESHISSEVPLALRPVNQLPPSSFIGNGLAKLNQLDQRQQILNSNSMGPTPPRPRGGGGGSYPTHPGNAAPVNHSHAPLGANPQGMPYGTRPSYRGGPPGGGFPGQNIYGQGPYDRGYGGGAPQQGPPGGYPPPGWNYWGSPWASHPPPQHQHWGGHGYGLLKPDALKPKEYDGSADSRAYNRFLNESYNYIQHTGIAPQNACRILALSMSGKAHDFYVQRVSLNDHQWTLARFFSELFNYCFPSDYQEKLRGKLRNARQGDKSVTEFSYEIQEFAINLGDLSDREMVRHFWHGLRKNLRIELMRANLGPETSSWDEVMHRAVTAERTEILISPKAEKPADGHTKTSGPSKPRGNGTQSNSGNTTSGHSHKSRPPKGSSQRPNHNSGTHQRTEGSSNKPSGHNQPGSVRQPSSTSGSRFGHGDNERRKPQDPNACFNCGEVGHMQRNCPKSNTVKGGGRGPPGVHSYNIEYENAVADESESVEVLTSMPFNSVQFNGTVMEHEVWEEYVIEQSLRPRDGSSSDDSSEHEGVRQGTHLVEETTITAPITIAVEPEGSTTPSESPESSVEDFWEADEVEWARYYPTKRPRMYTGDPWALQAEQVLNCMQPYPGDEPDPAKRVLISMGLRFEARCIKQGRYMRIADGYHNSEVWVPMKLLRKPQFDLAKWYARRRAKLCKIYVHRSMLPSHIISNAVQDVASAHLRDGISSMYPSIRPDTDDQSRFNVYLRDPSDRHYTLHDLDLGTVSRVSRHDLERHLRFNLPHWYLNMVNEGRVYDETHSEQLEREFKAEISNSWAHFSDAARGYMNEDPELDKQLIWRDQRNASRDPELVHGYLGDMGEPIIDRVESILNKCQPYPYDEVHDPLPSGQSRFEIKRERQLGWEPSWYIITIKDNLTTIRCSIHLTRLRYPSFSVGRWYAMLLTRTANPSQADEIVSMWIKNLDVRDTLIGKPIPTRAEVLLELGAPYQFENEMEHGTLRPNGRRFELRVLQHHSGYCRVHDHLLNIQSYLPRDCLEEREFNIILWYEHWLADWWCNRDPIPDEWDDDYLKNLPSSITLSEIGQRDSCAGFRPARTSYHLLMDRIRKMKFDGTWMTPKRRTREVARDGFDLYISRMHVYGVRPLEPKYTTIQRNSVTPKGVTNLPKPMVVTVKVNGHPCRALIDSGSLGDFVSTTLADQLKLKLVELEDPLGIQLAVQGSRSSVKWRTTVNLEYQTINAPRALDVININSYDLILGTPWMYQHKVSIGFNPPLVIVGSAVPHAIAKGPDTQVLVQSMDWDSEAEQIVRARAELMEYAKPLCRKPEEVGLPPLRAINHTIPLIDENKKYSWRPSKCPEAFLPDWTEKRRQYVQSGRWVVTKSTNAVPMMFIPKPNKDGGPPKLRTVFDLRERNANTVKMVTPLPNIDNVIRRVASKKYRSIIDLKDAYEQIRIVPEHVSRTAVTTPDGNIESRVVQQGDCNAPATCQALMNHLFSGMSGDKMDPFLDDLITHSNTIRQHVADCKAVMDILIREELYVSENKLKFFAEELVLLGRIVDDNGIRMDPLKVDSVVAWKVPTNRELLRGFLGAVGFLADDVPGIRIPMGVLTRLTSDSVSWEWTETVHRAFEEVKQKVHAMRDHSRKPIRYGKDAEPVWVITDGCATGIAGVIAQGKEWKSAHVSAFYSAKLDSAQQNYPVHEIEMLAGVETMLRYADVLLGITFKWLTDHKGLIFLLNQKNLSGRQARWVEKISSFKFDVIYLPGEENIMADALSRIYSNDPPGMERAPSEYTVHDEYDREVRRINMPVLAGIEAVAATRRSSRLSAPKPTVVARATPAPKRKTNERWIYVDPDERQEGELEGGNASPVITPTPITPTERNVQRRPPRAMVTTRPREQGTDSLLNIIREAYGDALDLTKELKNKYQSDTEFRAVMERPGDHRNFEVEDGLVYCKEDGRRLLCVPKIMIKTRSAREIVISEAHSMLAHLGTAKTLAYLRDHVWWKDLVSDVRAFCETCKTCKRSKPDNQKLFGLLHLLDIAQYPWQAMGIDFLGPLPESANRDASYNEITVVICLLTGMVHLIPSRVNYTAKELAELMFEHVYRHHGIPERIISDRDVLFTSVFWGHLHRLIGTKLKLSSAYHPQTDGATERANRTVTQMLRQCVRADQKDWVSRLPAIEFAINLARSESTGFSPFFLNSGRMPRTMIWNNAPMEEYPSVRNFTLAKKLAIMEAHDSVLASRIKQTRSANRKRREEPFKEGDLVYLSTQNMSFPKGLARKLVPKFIGPYPITRDHANHTFTVNLPDSLKARGIHPTFHASKLRPHDSKSDRLFPGRLDEQIISPPGEDVEWKVTRILSHVGQGKYADFEVLWDAGDRTWLPYAQVSHLRALDEYCELIGVTRDTIPMGRGNPPQDDAQAHVSSISPVLTDPIADPQEPLEDFDDPWLVGIKPRDPAPLSSPLDALSDRITRLSVSAMSIVASAPYEPAFAEGNPNFRRAREMNGVFWTVHVKIRPVRPAWLIVSGAQLWAYISFASFLAQQPTGVIGDDASPPLGYDTVANVWNETTLGQYYFPQIADDGTTIIHYPRCIVVTAHTFGLQAHQLGIFSQFELNQENVIRQAGLTRLTNSEQRRNERFQAKAASRQFGFGDPSQFTGHRQPQPPLASVPSVPPIPTSSANPATKKKREGKPPKGKKKSSGVCPAWIWTLWLISKQPDPLCALERG